MLYRRKVLVGLLEALDRTVSKVDLQKYAFLTCVHQDEPVYEFVPHRFGCFSFQVEADKHALANCGVIREDEHWTLCGRGYLNLLQPCDRLLVERVVREFQHLQGDDLIRYVYRTYPYYAINSEIIDEMLSASEKEKVRASRPVPRSVRLFTIGYQGKSLERYLNQLIGQAIGILCDIRKNPTSRKFGFGRRQLELAVSAMGMAYVNIPELGIESHRRQDLKSDQDYDVLLEEYVVTTLSERESSLARIVDLIREHGRLALTCYEANHNLCHRSRVVAALRNRPDFHHRVLHL